MIGINQQIQSRSGGGEGVGFAVPINVVKRSVAQLREDGRAKYAYLGVTSTPLYPQLVEHFELDVDKGAWIQTVNPGGPAEEAGLRGGTGQELFQGGAFRRGGDVITKLGGRAGRRRRRPLGRDRPLQARRDRGRGDPPRRRDADS